MKTHLTPEEAKTVLPCPFCAHKMLMPHVKERTAKTAGGYHYFVRCPTCHTEGPRSLSSKAEAVEKWNQRAALSAPAAPSEKATMPPKGWYETLRAMTNNLETFGPYSQETARVAIEGCMNALEELEAESAAAPAAVEGQEPVAWMRKWHADGEKPVKVKGRWPAKFKFLPVSAGKVSPDDVALYASPQAPVAAVQWQPIETAPTDGTLILLGRAADEENDRSEISTPGRWHEEDHDGPDNMGHDAGFMDEEYQQFRWGRSFGNPAYMGGAYQPTHWMPLPPAPDA